MLNLVLAIILIILLVKLRCDLGVALILSACALGLATNFIPSRILKFLYRTALEKETIELLLAILLIQFLGELTSRLGYLTRFIDAVERIGKSSRMSIAIGPLVGGLLPMPGGALLSAPLVATVSANSNITAEQKTFINYWFRHPWEFILPIYPGIILTASILKIPIYKVSLNNLPLFLSMLAAGILILRKLPILENKFNKIQNLDFEPLSLVLKKLLIGLAPIGAVIIGVLILKLDLLSVVITVLLFLILLNKCNKEIIAKAGKKILSFSIISLILGVVIFKDMLVATEIVKSIPKAFSEWHIPSITVIFALPFLIGLITGLTSAFVGVTFPILLSLFMVGNKINMDYLLFAYAGGMSGVLLSPVHLCLILSKEYFKANLLNIYRIILPPLLFVISVGLLCAIFF